MFAGTVLEAMTWTNPSSPSLRIMPSSVILAALAYDLVARGELELVKLGRKSLITGRSINKLKSKLLEQIAA